jgi:hypothetical protein
LAGESIFATAVEDSRQRRLVRARVSLGYDWPAAVGYRTNLPAPQARPNPEPSPDKKSLRMDLLLASQALSRDPLCADIDLLEIA